MARDILKDFPAGPLDHYRKQATFDWKSMKIILESEEEIVYTEELVNNLKNHSEFHPVEVTKYTDEWKLANRRLRILMNLQLDKNFRSNTRKFNTMYKNVYIWDPSTAIKYIHNIHDGMTLGAIRNLGTERHMEYVGKCIKGEILGCFCLTEIAHGSNTKAMRTTAIYDKDTKDFVLNTPDFKAAKCWAAVGIAASFALVYAQLYLPNGKHCGLHLFIVDIRDPKSLIPYPGVKVGNMGLKSGLNGIDNGFLMFDNYRIPRENLLNKIADVTEDGEYILRHKDSTLVFKEAMSVITGTRLGIVHTVTMIMSKAITIGIRYSAVRKQFGPKNDDLLILEYQITQYRLFPHLSMTYMLIIFCNHFLNDFYEISLKEDITSELHAISCAGKCISSWMARDLIQECREVCAGLGYLKVSELPDMRNYNDANITYDGENSVLIQQTSNWLIKSWEGIINGKKLYKTKLNSIRFLKKWKDILQWKFFANDDKETLNPIHLLRAYKWLICYLLKESHEKMQQLKQKGLDSFTIKNDTQIYYLRSLSFVYFEHFVMAKVYEFLDNLTDTSLKRPLFNLLSLFGAYSLDKHMTTLYQGGYACGSKPAFLIKQGILNICEELKIDAVGLVDAIAPNDFFITSPLGKNDGQMYKHLENALFNATAALSRPDWWQEIINFDPEIKSKL